MVTHNSQDCKPGSHSAKAEAKKPAVKSGTTHANSSVLMKARAYNEAGLPVIPILPDGSKMPAVEKGNPVLNRKRLARAGELASWFGSGNKGIGILGGPLSGNLERLDFDADADKIYPAWCELVQAEMWDLLNRLPVVQTPADGFHVYYRCETVQGNQDLARRLATAEELQKKPKQERVVLIQTRGNNGYTLAPGSPPECHELGKPYVHFAGPPLTEVPTITPEERDLLLEAARSFNSWTKPEPQPANPPGGELRPGDKYNASGPSWAELLEPHGWQKAGDGRWRRPGKPKGLSATTGYCTNEAGHELLYVFSSNASPFEPEKCYTKFAAYAHLNHQGDFKAATKVLAANGYGTPPAGPKQPAPFMPGEPKPPAQPTVTLIKASTVTTKPVEWLWPKIIPLGKLFCLDGDPDLGKSTVLLDIAARVTIDGTMPGNAPGICGPVVVMSSEDDINDTIVPRLKAAGANLARIHLLDEINGRPPVIPHDIPLIEEELKKLQARMLCIDPLMAYLAVDTRSDQQVRAALHPLKQMAARQNCTVGYLRHLNKGGGTKAMYRGGGSIAIIAAARAAVLIAPDPQNPNHRVFAPFKGNLSAKQSPLRYALDWQEDFQACRVGWISGPCDYDADDLLQPPDNKEEKTQKQEAEEFLKAYLEGGAQPAAHVYDAAKLHKITDQSTLRYAKGKLGIISKPIKDDKGKLTGWQYELPPSDDPET